MKKNFDGFIENNGVFRAANARPISEILPSGTYTLLKDTEGNLYFKEQQVNHDELIALPDEVYEDVVNEMTHFLKPETKQKFADLGYLYKRSSLLFGLPGTGKTSIVNRVSKVLLDQNGVVIFNPDPRLLVPALEILKERQPDQTVLVIFEELEQLVYSNESALLNILDGEIQTENIIYLATTNFINKIPPRIVRPGRFSSVKEVGFPNMAARQAYLENKLDAVQATTIADCSAGLSIDELKEVVQSVECFNYDHKIVIDRIKNIKAIAGKDGRDTYSGDEYDEELEGNNLYNGSNTRVEKVVARGF